MPTRVCKVHILGFKCILLSHACLYVLGITDMYTYTILFSVVPCAPVITVTHLDCNTDSIQLQWTPIVGSISYIAKASTPGGLISTCSSNNTHCELTGLTCGQTYSVRMISYDGVCHSTNETGLDVASGKKSNIIENVIHK